MHFIHSFSQSAGDILPASMPKGEIQPWAFHLMRDGRTFSLKLDTTGFYFKLEESLSGKRKGWKYFFPIDGMLLMCPMP